MPNMMEEETPTESRRGELTKARWPRFARVAVGLGLVVLILRSVEISAVAETLRSSRLSPFLAIGLAVLAHRMTIAYKWTLLLRAQGITIGLRESARLCYIGALVGTVTPGAVSGAAYRVVALAAFDKTHTVVSTLLLERIIGLGVSCVAGALALPWSVRYLTETSGAIVWIVVAIALAAVALIAASLTPSVMARCARWIPFVSHPRVARSLREFYSAYSQYRLHLWTLAGFVGLAVVELLILIGVTYLATRTVRLDVPLSYLVCVMPLVNVLTRLPITVSGIGVFEGLFVFIVVGAGYSPEAGLSVALVQRITEVLFVFLPAAVMLWSKPMKLRIPGEQT